MANRFLSNIRINDAYTFPASDGNDGQVITTDGAGNLAFENISPDAASVIYRDNFTGDGSTVTFDLQNSITDEDQTQIYIDGVYQEKSTYSISGTTITFTTAPILGHSVEVISISSINTGPTVLYQDNFTGTGSTTVFTLGQIIDNEIKTFIFLNGVYQFKNTYTLDGTTLTFDTAPANGVAIEVISIASATQSDSLQAGAVIIPVKNTHTASISKGTPVYITGNVGASERLQIAPADASNSAKMPAAGLLLTTLAVNAEGYVITGGYLRNITTDTIDGTSTSSNDTVYVKAGGGLTMTKPTGSNLIQNIAKVARSASGSAGSLIVSSILRTNDIPNLTTGKIWVGDSNTVESTVIHLDESNNRLGINNNNPSYSLDVTGDANISSNVIVGGNLTVQGTETILNTQTVEVEDNILQLNTTQGSPDTATATTSGISIYRGSGVTQASFIFDDVDDTWDLTNNLVVAGDVTIGGKTYPKISLTDNQGVPRTFSIGTNNETFTVRNETGSSDAFTISNSNIATFTGNVGIGVSPYSFSQLHIYDTSDVFLTLQKGTANGYIINDGTNISLASDQGTTGKKLLVNRSAPDSSLVIDSSGHVGIGTTSPATKLHIKNAPNNSVCYVEDTTGYALVQLGNTGGGLYFGIDNSAGTGFLIGSGYSRHIYSTGTNDFHISTNASPRITINGSSGNVGIGTESPSHLLTLEETDTNSVQLVIDNFNTSDAGTETSTIRFRHYRSYVAGLNDAGEITVGKEEAWDASGDRNSYMSFGTRTGSSGVTEKMRIDSSGNVQVGTDTPLFLYSEQGVAQVAANRVSSNGNIIDTSRSAAYINLYTPTSGSYITFHTVNTVNTSPQRRMTINGLGEFCIGTTELDAISTDVIHSIGQVLRSTLSSSAFARLVMQERQSNWISFVNGSGGHFGTIAVSGSGVSYGSNSDYRLKENIIQMTGALDRIAQLKPSRFNFIAEPEKTVDGFLAHEVQNIVPEAVTGEQDGTITTGNIINSNGDILEENVIEPETLEIGTSFEATSTQPKYQQLDPAKLVPLLVGAIQELKAEVETLKNQINGIN